MDTDRNFAYLCSDKCGNDAIVPLDLQSYGWLPILSLSEKVVIIITGLEIDFPAMDFSHAQRSSVWPIPCCCYD